MKPRTLSPILSNAGVAAAYRDKLRELINNLFSAYAGDLLSQIVSMSASGVIPIAQDARRKSVEEAEADFEKKAAALAESFVKSAETSCNAGIIKALKKAGFSQNDIRKLRKNPSAFEGLRQQIISENVKLITKIPAVTKKRIEGMVARSIEKDRDLGGLVNELKTVKSMTLRRAEIISRDQNNKVTEQFSLLRCQSLGITEGIWMHRGGAKVPRPEHVEFNGQKFNLSEGLFDEHEGRFVLPGELINCHCTYKPVLPDVLMGGVEAPEERPETPPAPVEPEQPANELNVEEDPKLTALREQERDLYEKLDAFGEERNKTFYYFYTNDEWNKRIKRLESDVKYLEDPDGKDVWKKLTLQTLKSSYDINSVDEARRLLSDMQSYRKTQDELFGVQKNISRIAGGQAASLEYVIENKIALRWDGGKIANEALAELHEGIRRAHEQFPELGDMQLTGSIQARQRQIKAALRRRESTSSHTYAYSASATQKSPYYPYNGIFLNEQRFSPNTIGQGKWTLRVGVKVAYHPIGCDTIKSVVDHEMGHQIDSLIGASNDPLLNRLYNRYKTKDKAKMRKALSEYAAKDLGEMIAEAYAECENNPKPRPFARAVMRRVRQLYKRKYGGS